MLAAAAAASQYNKVRGKLRCALNLKDLKVIELNYIKLNIKERGKVFPFSSFQYEMLQHAEFAETERNESRMENEDY